jgi:hypothetical protein
MKVLYEDSLAPGLAKRQNQATSGRASPLHVLTVFEHAAGCLECESRQGTDMSVRFVSHSKVLLLTSHQVGSSLLKQSLSLSAFIRTIP